MDTEIKELLEQLKKETGIAFSIKAENEGGPEETKERLRQMVLSCRSARDRDYFLMMVMRGEMSEAQVLSGLKRYHLKAEERYILYLIESCTKTVDCQMMIPIVSNLFGRGSQAFVSSMDATHLVLLRKEGKQEDVREDAGLLREMLNMETLSDVNIAYQTTARTLSKISESYREAVMSLEIGRTFYGREHIYAYDKLGIGRLIYELPVETCRAYLREVFDDIKPADLDADVLSAVSAFFENGLSLSETARALYLHRNTLVYRLKKLQRITGLDVRNFDDAMRYKIAVMIAEYLRQC